MEGWLKLMGGVVLLVYGIWSLIDNIEETKHGYKSKYGGDIKLYYSSIIAIVIGLILIYQEVF